MGRPGLKPQVTLMGNRGHMVTLASALLTAGHDVPEVHVVWSATCCDGSQQVYPAGSGVW